MNIICEECGIEFQRSKSSYERSITQGMKFFCSLKCSGNHKNRIARRKWGNGKTKILCEECGLEFEKRTADYNRTESNGKKHFCSLKCSAIHRNKNMTEEQQQAAGRRLNSVPHKTREDCYSPFREFMRRCQSKERIDAYGIPTINLEYLKGVWEIQGGICPYTGIKMILPKNLREYDQIRSPQKASLDRIDSSQGYVKGNVEFVCSSVNLAKNSFTRDEMMNFFSEIHQNHI